MSGMRQIVFALLTAAIGASLGAYYGFTLAVRATRRLEHTIRAERFELLGRDGNVKAYWGQSPNGSIVTAFVDKQGAIRAEFGVTQEGDVQWVRMQGPEGRNRVRLGTDGFSQASLVLGDDRHASRVIVGSIPSDLPVRALSWGLVFPRQGAMDFWAGIGIREGQEVGEATPFFSIHTADGKRWFAPVGK